MDYRFLLMSLGFPASIFLMHGVWEVYRVLATLDRGSDEPDIAELWYGLVGMVAAVAVLEGGLRLCPGLWEDELRKRPPGKPIPKGNPVRWVCWANTVHSQVLGVGAFFTTMDGGRMVGRPVGLPRVRGPGVDSARPAVEAVDTRRTAVSPLGVGPGPRVRRPFATDAPPDGRAGTQPVGVTPGRTIGVAGSRAFRVTREVRLGQSGWGTRTERTYRTPQGGRFSAAELDRR